MITISAAGVRTKPAVWSAHGAGWRRRSAAWSAQSVGAGCWRTGATQVGGACGRRCGRGRMAPQGGAAGGRRVRRRRSAAGSATGAGARRRCWGSVALAPAPAVLGVVGAGHGAEETWDRRGWTHRRAPCRWGQCSPESAPGEVPAQIWTKAIPTGMGVRLRRPQASGRRRTHALLSAHAMGSAQVAAELCSACAMELRQVARDPLGTCPGVAQRCASAAKRRFRGRRARLVRCSGVA